jgi:hypothetical protein
MIWMELTGGLGNQLFIWAAAHEVSRLYSEEICLFYVDNSKSRADRPIEISDLVGDCSHRIQVKKMNSVGILLRSFDYLSRFPKAYSFISKAFKFNDYSSPFESVKSQKRKPRLIRGYFQNDGLVESCRNMIETEIISEIQKYTSKSETLSIRLSMSAVCHVRRGDTNDMLQSVGQLSASYYESIFSPHEEIVIFSDKSEIKKEFSHFPLTTSYFTPDEFSSWETLSAMSSATKLIMANSTLSWWSAKVAIWTHGADVYIPQPWMKSLGLGEGLTLKGAQPRMAIYV